MASCLDEHSDYESEERIELDLDLQLGTKIIGLFTIDVTPKPATTFGEIRFDLADILEISTDDVIITYDKLKIQDTLVVKDHLDELKEFCSTHYFTVKIKESEEKAVAERLEQMIIDLDVTKLTDKSFILQNLHPDHETELLVYKESFYSYIRKNFT